MIFGCCFICAFLVLINKVCLQVTVEGFIGGSVVLPCSSAERDLKLQDINVLWRDKDSETMYDIIKGKASVERQDPQYKNRAETFPDEYERGNFSIKLINLNYTDAGEFSCFIIHTDDLCTIQLIIKESTEEKGNKTTEQE
uniref:Ig-like domain-containing protein n=1 Tax=Cyprinus carpio carpio TaxID=630221 RepID=A0A8C1D952_CYPCA